MLYWNVGFWDQGLWATDEMEELECQIHAILAPNLGMDDTSDWRKWINTKCDVLTVWTQVWHQADVLLTRDGSILGKAQQLAALRARVEDPATFAERLGRRQPGDNG